MHFLRTRLACIFGSPPSPMPHDTHIFLCPSSTEPFSVQTWSTLALNTDGIAMSCRCHITSIIHYKSTVKKNHEQLLCHTQFHSGGRTWFGCFSVGCSLNPDTSSSNLSITTISTSPSLNVKADDSVFVPRHGQACNLPSSLKDNQEELRQLTLLLDATLYVADVALLLPIISAYEKDYKPFSTQCYWFANIVYECIVKAVQGHIQTEGPVFANMAKHLLVKIPPKHLGVDGYTTLLKEWEDERDGYSWRLTLDEVQQF
jgi:hypothetical protein